MSRRHGGASRWRWLVLMLAAFVVVGGAPSTAAAGGGRPSVALTTPNGAVIVGPSAVTGLTITGTANDDGRLDYIFVEFCGGADRLRAAPE